MVCGEYPCDVMTNYIRMSCIGGGERHTISLEPAMQINVHEGQENVLNPIDFVVLGVYVCCVFSA